MVKRILNTTTGRYYKLRQKTTANGTAGQIMGLWSPKRTVSKPTSKRALYEHLKTHLYGDAEGEDKSPIFSAEDAGHAINVSYVNLAKADFSGENLRGASITFSNLQYANFQKANLYGVDFYNGVLCGSNFTGANCYGIGLRNCDLRNTIFRRANLTEADMSGDSTDDSGNYHVDLRYADLKQANLTNADLEGADLRHTDLTKAIIKGIKNLEKATFGRTIMPDGKIWDGYKKESKWQ